MAQWKYQFTGRTHATKILDVEYSLRLAVKALSICPETERAKKSKAVVSLCEKLLTARLKQAGAKMKGTIPRSIESEAVLRPRYERWRERAETIERGGVQHIVREFGVSEAMLSTEELKRMLKEDPE